MQTLEPMIADIIRREGGFVNDPLDLGGATKYGVTIGTLSNVLGRPATVADVQRITVEFAADIYRRLYYRAPGIDQLPARIQPFSFDTAVLFGPRRAIRFVQATCANLGVADPGPIDGAMGPRTRDAAAETDKIAGDWFLAALCERRRDAHRQRVRERPDQARFLKGWLNRVDEFDPKIKEAS